MIGLFAAVHESVSGRLCCKSRRHLVRSPKTGNIRIRRIEFLNQNSLFGLDLKKFSSLRGSKSFCNTIGPSRHLVRCSVMSGVEVKADSKSRASFGRE
jgi:hypothetical protein